jgi:hypothetical protein
MKREVNSTIPALLFQMYNGQYDYKDVATKSILVQHRSRTLQELLAEIKNIFLKGSSFPTVGVFVKALFSSYAPPV